MNRIKTIVATFASACALTATALGAPDPAASFDHTDQSYLAAGVFPDKLLGRMAPGDGFSVVAASPDSKHRDLRSTYIHAAYDMRGEPVFLTTLAEFPIEAFTSNAAGRSTQQAATACPIYIFPRDGAGRSVTNRRQEDLVTRMDPSANPIQARLMVFVEYTDASKNTRYAPLMNMLHESNGTDANGTPIIRTLAQLEMLREFGLVKLSHRPHDSDEGPAWTVTTIVADRDGGTISGDSTLHLATADLKPTDVEREFILNFRCLMSTGSYCDR